ncbi:hypothetical protein HGM15179_000567 [Zosterops borbonicus]|uniref:Uncharacterized protein n=1 Tax=Zosterops borbonicus TaxID=364589 RepID=A0A8K1GYS7_9PASS|nr:hypothetical protein HGM15179_000567 [Zosterops borbonicus]
MKTFLFLWLQLSPNSNLPSYMVNKPRAISITEMQEEKIQPRHTAIRVPVAKTPGLCSGTDYNQATHALTKDEQ